MRVDEEIVKKLTYIHKQGNSDVPITENNYMPVGSVITSEIELNRLSVGDYAVSIESGSDISKKIIRVSSNYCTDDYTDVVQIGYSSDNLVYMRRGEATESGDVSYWDEWELITGSDNIIFGTYINENSFQVNGADVVLKEEVIYIDTAHKIPYAFIDGKLVPVSVNLKKTVAGNTLNRIYTESGYALKSNGETVSASSYQVYKYDVENKSKVDVSGVSINSVVNEYCLACAYDAANIFLQSYYIKTGLEYTQQVIDLPETAKYLKVCGSDTHLPACYDVTDYDVTERWIFYTTEEVDALLANFNTEVSHDTTLKGNGKPENHLGVNEPGLNTLDKYFVNAAEKFQIGVNNNNILDLQNLWSNYARLQNTYKGFTGTIMNLEKDIAYYTMTLSSNSTITFNTSLLDTGKLWAFDVYFETTNYISVAFPMNVYFYGGNQMLDIGVYHYHFESKDNGLTWTANLVSKKINYIAENGKAIFVKTLADGGNDGNNGLSWATA